MTKQELIALCEKFQVGDRDAFQKIIAGFCQIDKGNWYDLSYDESPGSPGLAPPTVTGWIHNIPSTKLPHPLLQTETVNYIKNKIK